MIPDIVSDVSAFFEGVETLAEFFEQGNRLLLLGGALITLRKIFMAVRFRTSGSASRGRIEGEGEGAIVDISISTTVQVDGIAGN